MIDDAQGYAQLTKDLSLLSTHVLLARLNTEGVGAHESISTGGSMSNEMKIGGKSFVIDGQKDSFGPVSPSVRVEQHEEHTTSDTLVSALRPTPVLTPPAQTYSIEPAHAARSRVALLEGILSGRSGAAGLITAWLLAGLPCFWIGREIWFLSTDHLPDYGQSPSRFLLRILGLVAAEALPTATVLILLCGTLALFGRRKRTAG